jgi:hypothetical protein
MAENPYTSNEETFEAFTEAVSVALEFADIPVGVISGSNIADGSIEPENCALGATWDFSGGISSPGLQMMAARASRPSPSSGSGRLTTVTVYDHHILSKESVLLVNAYKKAIRVMLPIASKNKNRVYFIKRVDENSQSSCTVVPTRGDKIDLVTSIPIPERGCIMCISSGENWYILSNYS